MQNPEPFWVTLGVDPIGERLFIIGCSQTREEALAKGARRCKQAGYVRVFNLIGRESDEIGCELSDWFRSCGIVADQAVLLVREFGRAFGEMMRDIAVEKGWERPKK